MRKGLIIKARRVELGMKQPELAKRSGVTQPTISNIERGRNKGSGELAKIATALGLDPLALSNDRRKIVIGDAPDDDQQDHVPVVGTAQAGNDGFWDELQYPTGHGEGFVRYPSKDKNAYAIRVKGDSMRPRIKPGEFLLVEPGAALIPGEEVLVTTTNGKSMVKLLGPRRNGTVELQSVNEDHRPITIDESEIRAMHYVSAIVKSGRYYRDF